MSHKVARLLLEHADSFLQKSEAIRAALSLGMPLYEIESHLDWLDGIRAPAPEKNDSHPVTNLDVSLRKSHQSA